METTKLKAPFSERNRPALAAVLAVCAVALVAVYWFAPGTLGVAPKVNAATPAQVAAGVASSAALDVLEPGAIDDDGPAKQRPMVVDAKRAEPARRATR